MADGWKPVPGQSDVQVRACEETRATIFKTDGGDEFRVQAKSGSDAMAAFLEGKKARG